MSRIDSSRFETEDMYFEYDMDGVKLRWDHYLSKAFQKFEGEIEFECNGWAYFNKASNEGVEITEEDYYRQ